MPTITCNRDDLFEMLEETYTDHEFDVLCFEFGIELDDITSEKQMMVKEREIDASNTKLLEGLSEAVLYKIDVPANRYDLLCIEGIASALRIFLGKDKVIEYKSIKPDNMLTMTAKAEVHTVRPFVVCAVLRGIKFTPARYASFIDLQDKLHQNIGRRRALIAIGTHDLDTIEGPFTYEAKPQKDISFVPLSEKKEFRVDELFQHYKDTHSHLKPYLKITEKSPLHPVIYDKNGTLLSLPPIINGEHSKIKMETKNVFIECTGTDFTKLNIVLNTVIAMFSGYCEEPFSVECCKVVDEKTGKTHILPDLSTKEFSTSVDYINRGIGIDISASEMAEVLCKMNLHSNVSDDGKNVVIQAPITRTDILHSCDVLEDVAIAYGYNNIKKTIPSVYTVGLQQPINKVSDLIRGCIADAGYVEVLTFVLCNREENFKGINRVDDGSAVVISNPSTEEFNIVRTNLLHKLLKVLSSNKGMVNLPVKMFELSDVCMLDSSVDVGSRNSRRLAALHCSTVSGFESIHGLIARTMELNGVEFIFHDSAEAAELTALYAKKEAGDDSVVLPSPAKYWLADSTDSAFFPGRRADVYLNGKKVGGMGIVHPKVLANFQIDFPCSAFELEIEPFV